MPAAPPADDDTAEDRAARAILALAGGSGLGPLQRLAGARLDPLGRVRRLLLLHRLAFEAEAAGESVRADFFWTRFHETLPAMVVDARCGDALAAAAGIDNVQPRALWSRLVDEVFLDTHLAFYNGCAGDGAPRHDRALVHLAHAARLLRRSGMAPAEGFALGDEITRRQVEHGAAAGRWDDAAGVCAHVLERAPRNPEFQDRWVECVYRGALAALNPRGTRNVAQANREAISLLRAIGRVEAFRRAHPDAAGAFPALGTLYAAYAVRLAEASRLSEAVVSIERALAYDPWLQGGRELAGNLGTMLQQLRQQMRQVEADLSRGLGATLNATGEQLRFHARQGFGPLQTFRDSGEAARIEQARLFAWGLRLWRRFGLPELHAGAEAHVAALRDALDRVLYYPPDLPGGLAEAWARAAQPHPVLAACDPAPVLAYLRERLFDQAAEPAPSPPSAPPPAHAARLVPRRRRWQRREPIGYWLFTPGNLRVKAQALAALVLLLGFGVVWGRESLHLARRDAAYRQALAARGAGDDRGVMAAAEAFLGNPVLGRDGRDEQVKDWFSESVVRSALNAAVPQQEAREQLDRYNDLLNPGEDGAQ